MHPVLHQLNDAYEEVDEQRQSVAQWKRKTQKAHGEMNDVKLLLEEQVRRGDGRSFLKIGRGVFWMAIGKLSGKNMPFKYSKA